MSPFTLDGVSYNVFVPEDGIKRSGQVLDGDNAKRSQNGYMIRDIIGTYYNYTIDLDTSQTDVEEYDKLYEVLTAPVDYHTLVVPYGIESRIVYKYVDGAMVQFKNEALTQFSDSATFVYDDCIYYIYSQKTRACLYRYNPLTGENVLVGNIPQFSNYYLTVGGNEISFVGVTNTSSTHHPCFVVNIIEETA